MQRRTFLQSASAIALAASAPSAAQADQSDSRPIPQGVSGKIVLNEKEYFEGPGLVFLVFHNNYSGMQGGLQMIQNGERLLDSGSLLLSAKDQSIDTSAQVLRRVVNREQSTATVLGEVPNLKLGYQIISRTDGARMFVTVKLDRPLDWSIVREAGFHIFLYPPVYFQKSFQGEAMTGVFPRQFGGEPVLLHSTPVLRIAQEDPLRSVTFERRGGALQLTDERGNHPTAWFSVVASIEPGSRATEVEVEIRPSPDAAWRRAPVIGVSQVGYHPGKRKRAVVELDSRDEPRGQIGPFKMRLNGERELIKAENLKPWGRFLYYRYATLDFSEVVDPGVYLLEFRGQTAGPFRKRRIPRCSSRLAITGPLEDRIEARVQSY